MASALWDNITSKAWKRWLWVAVPWLVTELTKERIFAWANSKLDERASPLMPQVLAAAAWVKDNPIFFFLVFAGIYCLAVVINAQAATGQWFIRKKQSAPETIGAKPQAVLYEPELHHVPFGYTDSPINHGWTLKDGLEGNAAITTPRDVDSNAAITIATRGRRYAIDYNIIRPGCENVHVSAIVGDRCKRLRFKAKFQVDSAIYAGVWLCDTAGNPQLSRKGTDAGMYWIVFQLESDDHPAWGPYEIYDREDNERLLRLPRASPAENGWR
jgi:hypothetical protein